MREREREPIGYWTVYHVKSFPLSFYALQRPSAKTFIIRLNRLNLNGLTAHLVSSVAFAVRNIKCSLFIFPHFSLAHKKISCVLFWCSSHKQRFACDYSNRNRCLWLKNVNPQVSMVFSARNLS